MGDAVPFTPAMYFGAGQQRTPLHFDPTENLTVALQGSAAPAPPRQSSSYNRALFIKGYHLPRGLVTQLLAGTDAGTAVGGSCGGVGRDPAVQPHSMGGVGGGRRGTHTHTCTRIHTHTGTHTGTYTRMLHLTFSDLPLKKCPIQGMQL